MRIGKSLIALAMAVGLALVAGCATLTEGNTGAKTAVQFAALKVIDEDTERARRVHRIVGEVHELIDGDPQTTLDTIEERVREEIRWDRLDNAESLVVNSLIDVLREEIKARISEGVLEPDERVAVRNVLEWVEQAAAMAGGVSSDGIGPEGVAGQPTVVARRTGGAERYADGSGPGGVALACGHRTPGIPA